MRCEQPSRSSAGCIRASCLFDRTIKVSLTDRLTKEQISQRMPNHFRTIDALIESNQRDFRCLVTRSFSQEQKAEIRKRYIRRRQKLVLLVEELSLRSRRVVPIDRSTATNLGADRQPAETA